MTPVQGTGNMADEAAPVARPSADRRQGVRIVIDHASQGAPQLNRSLLIGGGVLLGLAGLLGFTGAVLVSSALISATRQWVDRLEQPPTEIARRRWEQTKAAAAAGAAAWRNEPQTEA
jgi:hypothetical protein